MSRQHGGQIFRFDRKNSDFWSFFRRTLDFLTFFIFQICSKSNCVWRIAKYFNDMLLLNIYFEIRVNFDNLFGHFYETFTSIGFVKEKSCQWKVQTRMLRHVWINLSILLDLQKRVPMYEFRHLIDFYGYLVPQFKKNRWISDEMTKVVFPAVQS